MLELTSGWSVFGILGVICALIYRIPQAKKIYQTKKSDDVSMKSFSVQTASYMCFIIYMCKYYDTILFFYYISGGLQNLIVLYLIKKYRSNKNITKDVEVVSTDTYNQNNDTYINESIPESLQGFTDVTI
tara:strand:- start:1259 stop:1648 length:390 start_codon:yes stop_codon:yes gene_type:complete